MNIKELKTKYCLDPEDLPNKSGINVLTIVGLESTNFAANENGRQVMKTRHNLWFRELQLPLRLNNTRIDILGKILGEETDGWKDRKIGLFIAAVSEYGKTKLSILIDLNPQDSIPSGGGPAQLPSGGVTNPDGPIGETNAKRFSAALAEQGASFEDFLAWLKRTDRPAHDTTIGLDLSDLKRSIAPLMQRFLREYQNPPAPAATPVEKPRELVEQATTPNLHTTGKTAATKPIDPEDDIPF